MHRDVRGKRLLSPLTGSFLLGPLLAFVPGVVFGQDALALSSGTAVAGGAIALNLSLNSPVGSEPAGVQWTLTYPAGNTASIGAVAGSSATAADETITCFSGAGSYTCLLSGMNDAVIQNGVVAVINVTMTSSAGTTPIGLTNLAGATAAGSPISVTGTGGTITLPAPLVLAPTLAGLSCNPASLSSGASSICTAALSEPASSAGVTVNLSSSTGALPVPASVTVPSGSTTGSFTATTNTFTANQTAVVTASYNGSSQTASISLVAPTASAPAMIPAISSMAPNPVPWEQLTTLTVNGSNFQSGFTGSVTVAGVNYPVPASCLTFVSSSEVQVAVYMGGATSYTATLNITNPGGLAASQNFQVGSSGGVQPAISSMAPNPVPWEQLTTLTVNGSNFQSGFTGSVTVAGVNYPVPASCLTFVSSSEVQVAVYMGGATSYTATLNITNPGGLAASQNFQVGSSGGVQPAISSMAPNPVPWEQLTTLTVNGSNFQSGFTGSVTVAGVNYPVPASCLTFVSSSEVQVAVYMGGATSYTATLNITNPGGLAASQNFQVGSSGGVQPAVSSIAPNPSETTSVGLQPASSQSGASIACNPDPNKVGGLDCGVSLAQAAPVSGVTVALQANTSRVQVPVQVVIPAGALSVPFAATVISSDQDTQAQITASVQGALTTASIPITGIRPTSLSCVPQTVQAGGSFTCTVGMNIPNVLQVARLSVSSDSTSFELPSPFTTRPGQAQLSFEVFTTPLAGQQSSAVTVQFGQTSVTSSAAVTPATAPILNLPGTELAAFGQPLAFTFSAVDPGDLPLTLSAANLPAGASFDPATGSFLWTPQAPAGPIHQLGNSSPLERREVTFTATNSARISSTGSVVIEADPGLPVISDLRNAGSQQSQGVFPKAGVPTRPTLSCSPGSVASLLGRWLALGTQPTSNPTGSSTQLAGAEVIVNGNPAPIVYASATRLDFLCPEAAPAGELEISAQTGGAVSNVVDANQQATLGLFSANGSGQGQAMATLAGTSLLATPRSYLNNGQPAEPGDAISILATGAGLDASPALLRISIGGAYTTADQVQPMPGMAGVYRIDVTVPASVASGDAVPVIVQVPDSSGQTLTSNTVTIAVEAR